MPLYSIIILTYNRSATLKLALESVTTQTIEPEKYEILIIDDESTDNTAEVVKEYALRHPNHTIRYHRVPHGGEAKGRNIGIQLARGKYIFFTDDDCVVPPDWLERYAEVYRSHPDIAGVGGFSTAPPSLLMESPFNRYIEAELWHRSITDAIAHKSSDFFENTGVGNTANMSYKKEVLKLLGGFDEIQNFSGSVDYEFKKRVCNRGLKLYYLPLGVFHLKKFNSLKSIWKLAVLRGRGIEFYREKFSDFSFLGYGKGALRWTWQEAVHMKKNFSLRFGLYFIIAALARYIGQQQLLRFGPHPNTYKKSQAIKQQNYSAHSAAG